MGGSSDRPKSLFRSLGEFVGHIASGIRARPGDSTGEPPAPRPSHEVGRRTETRTTDDGVILRRTTIEEIEFPPGNETDA